jgi:hypothetical protein
VKTTNTTTTKLLKTLFNYFTDTSVKDIRYKEGMDQTVKCFIILQTRLSKILDIKKEWIKQLKEMNTEAEKRVHVNVNSFMLLVHLFSVDQRFSEGIILIATYSVRFHIRCRALD